MNKSNLGRNTIRIFIATSLIFINLVAEAQNKTLIISDIDDTVKVSHVLSLSMIVRAGDLSTAFTGMAQLYQLLINQNPQNTHIAYVSNAPETFISIPIMQVSHELFLQVNRFPDGYVLLRKDLSDKTHKIRTIRNLVTTHKPETVILVGDNGEEDVAIYAQASRELGAMGIRTSTYIHQLYSKNALLETGKMPLSGQMGFVTPIEVAIDLNNKNILNTASLKWMIDNIVPFILNEKVNKKSSGRNLTFPSFKDCSDFKWPFAKVPSSVLPLYHKIQASCH